MDKAKILIVEDENIVAQEIEDILVRTGYDVCAIVSSGEKAIAAAGAEKPDLILMDINLQGEMDGIETAESIRKQFDLPVVYLTAFVDEETTKRAKFTQPLGYIQKPFQQSDLRITTEMALYTAGIDVERKRKTEELIDSKKRYHDLFNSMIDGFAVHEMLFDADGVPCDYRFLSLNPAFERYTGLKAEDILGRTVLEVLPDIEKSWIDLYGSVVLSGKPIQFNNYSEKLKKHFNVNAYAIKNNRFACSFVDVTDREKAEARLAWESSINSVLADISVQLMLPDRNMKIISELILEHSQSVTQSRYGYTSVVDQQTGDNLIFSLSSLLNESRVQKSLQDSAFPTSKDDSSSASGGQLAIKRKSIYNNHPPEYQGGGVSPEEHIQINNYLSAPVFVEGILSGQIVLGNSTVGYSEDDLKAVEQIGELYALAIQRQRNESENETMQKQIRQMQKMDAIGTLASGIAHDFNNILQPVMGYASLALKNTEQSEKNFKYFSSILIAAKRARELVQQILTFARKGEQELQPVEIQPIIKEALKLLRSSLPASIEIRQKISQQCGTVMADSIKIHQIVMNLATNAYHAMQKDGGVMEVSLMPVELELEDIHENSVPSGNYNCLVVSDTGVGIEREVLDKIFDPYFTTKVQSKGTGLGLSVVQGIVKSHGGKIEVSSEPGRGSEFKVFLPQIVADKKPMGQKINQTDMTGHERILLIDDETEIVDSQKEILQELGYQVNAMTNSLIAFEVFKQQMDQFDLVVTDMTMPQLSGIELARQMLALRPDLPIIICTGFSELITEEIIKATGIKKLLMKPISPDQLGQSIRDVLDDN